MVPTPGYNISDCPDEWGATSISEREPWMLAILHDF